MIAAVYLRMTVQAGASEQLSVGEIILDLFAAVGRTRMTGGRVAGRIVLWGPVHQQGRMVAAVWLVANCTVFRGRRMLPYKRSAFFCVTAVTGFIDC